ncbi:MAG: hypothetical protein ACLPKI_32070 [Streptosporangiaceae bacterium]
MVMTFTVTPQDGGPLVRISTTWEGTGGIGGLLERLFAPRVMRGMHGDEPEPLDAYARAYRDT